MTLIDQLAAERRALNDAVNEAQRLMVDPNRYRSDADRARLAATDTARIVAEQALNAAFLEQVAANKAVNALVGEDWASLFWVDLQPGKMTAPMREVVARARAAPVAADAARETLQKAVRAHQAAVREIGAAAAAKRRAAKMEAGQLTTVAEAAGPARQAPRGHASRYNNPKVKP